MADIFSMIISFMKTTALTFEFNGNTYSFTFWALTVALLVVDVGVLIIRRISS